MQKQNLWLAPLFSTAFFDIVFVGENNAYFIYCSVVLQWCSSLPAKMLPIKPWKTHNLMSQIQLFQLAKQLAIRKSIALINISLKKWQVSAE